MIVAEPFEALADAFCEIEKRDLKVDKVTLEPSHYYRLLQSKVRQNFRQNLMDCYRESGSIGLIWGAKVELGEKSQVFSEVGYTGRTPLEDFQNPITYSSQEEFDNIRVSEEIDFNGIKYKLRRLKNNLIIIVKSRAEPLFNLQSNEWVAIQTLRDMISEAEYRKYMTHGFILVKGKSGKIYQIFRNSHHTRVWRGGKIIEEVCVRLKNQRIPPTDNLIAFKTMIETDEEEFRKAGNLYKMDRAA